MAENVAQASAFCRANGIKTGERMARIKKCGARGKRRKNQDGQRRANSADYKMRCAGRFVSVTN